MIRILLSYPPHGTHGNDMLLYTVAKTMIASTKRVVGGAQTPDLPQKRSAQPCPAATMVMIWFFIVGIGGLNKAEGLGGSGPLPPVLSNNMIRTFIPYCKHDSNMMMT